MNFWLTILGMAVITVVFIVLLVTVLTLPARLVNSHYDKKEAAEREKAFADMQEDYADETAPIQVAEIADEAQPDTGTGGEETQGGE